MDGTRCEYCDFVVLCFDLFDEPKIIKTTRCSLLEFNRVKKKLKEKYNNREAYSVIYKKQNIEI